ncbi:MAG: hypothetical protein APU95_02460 [Hadesarchaea archaeon YNP_N21]|nr:MAG: hypothetical protein APU95_02460 [Hadesarchaea archaeon YNP_N21]
MIPLWAISIPIFIIYFVIVLWIGYRAYKRGKRTVEDYYIAGRETGPLFLFFTYVATFVSAFGFLGLAGMYYTHGVGMIAAGSGSVILAGLLGYFIGTRLHRIGKKFGHITPSDYFADYYQSDLMRAIYAIAGVMFIIPYIALQYMGGGYLFEVSTGGAVPFHIGATITFAVAAIYSILGGLRAVIITDFIQGVMMYLGFFIAFFAVGFLAYPNPAAGFAAVASVKPELLTVPGPLLFWTPMMILSYYLMNSFGHGVGMPYSWMRFYAAKNEKAVKTALLLSPLFTCLLQYMLGGFNIIGRSIFPDLTSPDTLLPRILFAFAPAALAAFVCAAGFAALMSSVDSFFAAATSLISLDLYGKLLKRGAKVDEKTLVRVGMIFIGIIMLLGLVIAWSRPGLLVMLGILAFSGGAQFAPALIGSLFWKRGTKVGAILSSISGIATMLTVQSLMPGGILGGFNAGTVGFFVAWAVYIVASLLSKPLPDSHIEKFRKAAETPVD